MKYTVVGPRLLVKVKKFKKEDIETFEGSIIHRADVTTDNAASETTNQCVGEVVQLGDMAYKRKDSGCDGTPWVQVGDQVHFSRYGAMRIGAKTKEAEAKADFEFWVLMDKDILLIERDEI